MFQNLSFFRSFAALIVCGLAASGCAVNTSTYGTGQKAGSALAKDIGSIATFGYLDGSDKKVEINYHQREPLVTPPKEGFKTPPRPITGFTAEQISLKREADAFEREFLADQERLANKGPQTEAEILAEQEALFEKQLLKEQKNRNAALISDEEEPKKKGVFSRLIGKSVKRDNSIRSNSELTEVPETYRIPEQIANAPTTDPFAKKKKKKRFLLF